MKFSKAVEEMIAAERAVVHVGYPPWLRPFLQKDVIGITLGRHIFLSERIQQRSPEYVDRLLRHELAHVRQVNRHGFIGFGARYVGEFLKHLASERSMNGAYKKISFEVEANAAEESL